MHARGADLFSIISVAARQNGRRFLGTAKSWKMRHTTAMLPVRVI